MNRLLFFFGMVASILAVTPCAYGLQQQKQRTKEIRNAYVNQFQCLRESDEAWLIKLHDKDGCPDPTQLTVKQQQSAWQEELEPTECGWVDRQLVDLAQSHLSDPEMQTVIYIPGWRSTECSSLRQANQVYAAMTASPDLPPVRFVYLVWKSAKTEKRIKTDYLKKSEYSKLVGQCLLPLMTQFQNRDVVFVGHSLGAQVTLTFLTQRNTLPDDGTRYKAAFLGSALHCEFAAEVAQQECQLQQQTSRSLILNNRKDFALRASTRRVCAPRLGRKAGKISPIVEQKLIPLGTTEWVEVDREVRCHHDIAFYVMSKEFPWRFARLLNSGE